MRKELVREVEGSGMKVPFMILSFVGLVAVPDMGVTELGMVHTVEQRIIDVVLDEGDFEVEDADDHEVVEGTRLTRVCCRCSSAH